VSTVTGNTISKPVSLSFVTCWKPLISYQVCCDSFITEKLSM